MSFASQILEVANGEPIDAVVIGYGGWGMEDRTRLVEPQRNVLLTWEQAEPMLDYDYDDGYGLPECDAIWAWTASQVLFVSQYDGSTRVESVPRNPLAGEPDMPGGS